MTIDLLGLTIGIDGLSLELEYAFKEPGPRLEVRLVQPPDKLWAGGRLLHVFPIWLVDMLMPSSTEKILNDFFHTLAMSNRGRGAEVSVGSFPNSLRKEVLWVRTRGDVLSNGAIKLGFNLQRQLLAEDEELLQEAAVLRKELWTAFDQDFKRIRSQGWCQ
jgi:hypothetical protein